MKFVLGLPRRQRGVDINLSGSRQVFDVGSLYTLQVDYKRYEHSKLFFREVVRLYGVPKSITSN